MPWEINFTIFNFIIICLWFFNSFIDYCEYVYYWQLKWYRFDRYLDFLKSEQGKIFIFRKSYVIRTAFASLIFLWPVNEMFLIKIFIIIFYLTDFIYLNYRRIKGHLYRPIFSLKAILIIFLAFFFESVWILYYRNWQVVLLALVMRPILIALTVLLVNFCTDLIKKVFFIRAKNKMKKYKNLLVIGITGSYGKTTTKEFLFEILSKKFKVFKTPENINSDLGVSRLILNTDFSAYDIFIVEIGAYNVGDVKLLCDIVKPKIGILTAINEQHLSLFGNIKNTQKAKYELLNALPSDGLGITNSDNEYCRELLDEPKARILTFGMDEEYKPNMLIEDAKMLADGMSFTVKTFFDDHDCGANLITKVLGIYNTLNIAPCILTALYLKMDRQIIIDAVNNLKNPHKILDIFNYGKAIIIDASYNSNPDGFRADLEILNSYPSTKKRIVVTRGMLELGEKSEELHEAIGGEIAYMADELVISTSDFIKPLKKGVGNKYHTEIKILLVHKDLLDYIKSLKNKEVVILLENRMPSILLKELEKYKNKK
ncbi:MAG: UDP-N-acetylmuramoyl-tripeptide--D-alanyl-D-alanine ligase [Patescibacteria group bacterium]